ncbi:MAG: UbiA family prenyltransferase [FCB group bacterium]|nr:UbiA family prenyltransferase [FCB group bacterium]
MAYLSLIRLPNCLMAAAGTAVGQFLSPAADGLGLSAPAMAVSFFVCGFGNIFNDLNDIEADRINHPQRALPSGRLTPGQAKVIGFYFLVISLILMIWLSNPGRIIVVVALMLLIWYNLRLKQTAYWGNLTVSLLGAMTFFQGGAVAGMAGIMALPGPIIPAVFAFLIHGGREIIKDVEDIAGDIGSGSRTAPIRTGSTPPLIVAHALLSLMMILALSVYFLDWFNLYYLAIIIPLVIIPTVGQMIRLGLSPDQQTCNRVATLIKLGMLPGIVALVIGRVY